MSLSDKLRGYIFVEGKHSLQHLCCKISRIAHNGQKYGDHDYFEEHIKSVVRAVTRLYEKDHILKVFGMLGHLEGVHNHYRFPYCVDVLRSVAYLHDTVEDTELTLTDLKLINLPDVVVGAVDSLTKRPDESGQCYLDRLVKNPIAIEVKKADSLCNLKESLTGYGDPRRVAKYTQTLNYLVGEHG